MTRSETRESSVAVQIDEPADAAPAMAAAENLVADLPTGNGLSAFQSRPFLLFWSTLVLSLTGVWIRITAQGYLVYALTKDEFLLGLVSFFGAAPVLIVSPIAGAVLDRVDRRRVLLAVQMTQASAVLALAVLVATGRIQVWHVLATAVIVGAASGFDWPARLAMVPTLLQRYQLQSGVALTAAAFNGSRVIGPLVAGLLIGLVGLATCFFVNAFTYLPFILVLASLAIDRATPVAATGPTVRGRTLHDLLDGYRYIWRTPAIRGMLSVDIFPLSFGMAYQTLAPALARDVLSLGGTGYGLLLAANGVGTFLGSATVAMRAGSRRRGRRIIIGVGCFGAMVIAYALSSNALLTGGLILLIGLASATYATTNDTLVQTTVDDAYRGRVLAVYSMLWGLTPIGGLEAGWLARVYGVQTALAVNGILVLCYVPILYRFTPLREID